MALSIQANIAFWLGNKAKFDNDDVECTKNLTAIKIIAAQKNISTSMNNCHIVSCLIVFMIEFK